MRDDEERALEIEIQELRMKLFFKEHSIEREKRLRRLRDERDELKRRIEFLGPKCST